MKKVQSSPWGKGLAVVLFLIAAFSAGLFAIRALLELPYALAENWQDTARFSDLIYDRQDQLAELCNLDAQLTSGTLSYAEQQQNLQLFSRLESYLSTESTWFRYQILTEDGQNILYSNIGDQNLAQAVKEVYYATFLVGEHYISQQPVAQEDIYAPSEWGMAEPELGMIPAEGEQVVIQCGVPEQVDGAVLDEFFTLWNTFEEGRISFHRNIVFFAAAVSLGLLCAVYILWTGGHKAGQEEIVLTWQDRIFFDLYLAAMVALGVGIMIWGVYLGDYLVSCLYYSYTSAELAPLVKNWLLPGVVMCLSGVIVLILRTFTVRLKAQTLIHSTLICRVVIWLGRVIRDFIRSLPITWRVVGAFAAYIITSAYLLLAAQYSALAMGLWWVVNLGMLVFLAWWTMNLRKLRQGTRAISAGNMEHRIDTARMPRDLKLQAEDLNNISVGMADAVDEKMKSERFKAELITNVSHDLKTPLTSIINYVNLLKTTEQTDPTAQQYIEVLDRKSQRLKKLTEDLVEASKASTGVLSVNREKIGMAQLMDQAMGEWEERLQARHLTVISNLSEGETWVYADGRHLWRVIDNLLSNCAKYAMEGTRIYVDLNRGKGQVSLSVKNISRDALNVPAERLVERFVRGDESRTTEGSGLGLSIARSLTELQGGQFELAVDGDLFKATVTLPQAN